MKQIQEMFEAGVSFRRGSNAVGVRAELSDSSIPFEIKNFLNKKKNKKK